MGDAADPMTTGNFQSAFALLDSRVPDAARGLPADFFLWCPSALVPVQVFYRRLL
jgi:hypothetical protein